jgi:hypothetical protein
VVDQNSVNVRHTSRPPGLLLISHVVIATSIAPTYFLVSSSTAQDNSVLVAVRLGLGAFSAFWSVALFYAGILSDEKEFTARLKRIYCLLLDNRALLSLSLLVLVVIEGFLLHQLLFLRPVHLMSATDVEVLLNNIPGSPSELGDLAGEPCARAKGKDFRLAVGTHEIAFRIKGSGEVIAGRSVIVPPIWAGSVPNVACIDEASFNALR